MNDSSWSGFAVFVPAMALVVVTWWLASPLTLRHARLVQRIGQAMVGSIKGLAEWWDPKKK